MDRKGIIGLVCAVLGFVLWQYYYVSSSQEALRAQKEAAAAAAAAAPPAVDKAPATPIAATPMPAAAPATAPVPPAVEPALEEQRETVSTPVVDYAFSNLGGGIARAVLLQHRVEDHRNVTLNAFGTIPIGAISEVAGEATAQSFTMRREGPLEVIFERTDARQIEIRKKFILPKVETLDPKTKLSEEYRVRLEVSFSNRAAQPIALPGYFIHTGAAAPIHRLDQPIYTGFNWFRDGSNKFVDVNWFSGGGFLFFSHPERPVYSESHGKILWAGVTNQYFTTIVAPEIDANAPEEAQTKQSGKGVWATRLSVANDAWKAAGHFSKNENESRFGVNGALGMAGVTLPPGGSVTQAFSIYIGPREYRRLAALGHEQEEIMDFGMFGIVSKALLVSMNWLRSWLGNYALAIVVLTLIIKTLMWPLQNKATNSMKRMALLQPKMTELREKYKDDPTRMNAEIMKLYKDYKINPMSGCLPMLVQIPIFFGFYNMLGKAVELRNSKFLWVDDLSQPDTIFRIPGIDIPINPLPLLMAVTMFWQMAISPKSGDPVQQRVFMFVPLIFIFFCYNFASALALYWTVQNLFSVAQLYLTRNQAAPELVKAAPPPKKKSRA